MQKIEQQKEEEMRCSKCNQDNSIEAIFHNKRGMKFQFCEDCISKIDFSNIDTYIWFFYILDLPYLQDEWNSTIDYCEKRYSEKMPIIVFRKYLGRMRLAPYKSLKFNNSDFTIEGEE